MVVPHLIVSQSIEQMLSKLGPFGARDTPDQHSHVFVSIRAGCFRSFESIESMSDQ
jgi:hypothetical protein